MHGGVRQQLHRGTECMMQRGSAIPALDSLPEPAASLFDIIRPGC
jgi:hypothetical protein